MLLGSDSEIILKLVWDWPLGAIEEEREKQSDSNIFEV